MFSYEKKYALDDPRTTLYHKEIIKNKSFLKKLYVNWYREQIQDIGIDAVSKKILEIGSGGGFIKEIFPFVITSDIMQLDGCDMIFSAEKMPFDDNTLDAIIMLNVFHHIPDVENFIKEAKRVLKPAGKIVMTEPANSFFSRFIYQNFHHENFDVKAVEWKFPSEGPLSSANGALPWIVFERDSNIFNEKFSNFKIKKIKYHTPLAYLLSGGVSFKSLVPAWSYSFIRIIEKLLSPLSKYMGMFVTIVIEKK